MNSKDVNHILALARQTIKCIETDSYPRDIMALLNRIHTEATKLGENTEGLSANELDAIERYGVSGILRAICFYHLCQISTLYRWKHAPPVRTTFGRHFRDLISFVVKAAAYCIVKYALGDITDKQSMIQGIEMATALGKGWIDCQYLNRASHMLEEASKMDTELHYAAYDKSTCGLDQYQCLLNLTKAELELVQNKNDLDSATRYFTAACGSQSDLSKNKMLYLGCINALIGQRVLTSGSDNHALHWIANTSSAAIMTTMCAADLSAMILDLIGRLITHIDLPGLRKSTAINYIKDIISGVDLCSEISEATNEYFFAKIHLLLQLCMNYQSDKCYLLELEEAYIAAMENVLLDGDCVINWIACVFRAVSQYLDFKSVAHGVQVLVQRIAILDNETSPLSVPALHMVKLYLLSEAACIQETEELIDLISTSIDYRAAWNLGLQMLGQCAYKFGCKVLMQSYKFIGDMDAEAIISPECRAMCYYLSIIEGYMDDHTLQDYQSLLAMDENQTMQLPMLIRYMRLEALVALKRFDDAIMTFSKTGMVGLTEISLCERIAERILLDCECSLEDALEVLEVITSLIRQSHCQSDHDIIVRYGKWTRIKITTSLVMGKTKGLEVSRQVVSDLKQRWQADYPEDELHFLIVTAWNEGISSFMDDDKVSANAWCTLSFDLLPLLKSEQKRDLLQDKLLEAYNDMGVKQP
ncbi:hypothetical protein K492DRAFT_197092 [Lichtheimia hyalospora FSU 10163]|nr:hypothetical protein K492DRAFT_197092 [Lichtheimia hyalospora FSU 10163]